MLMLKYYLGTIVLISMALYHDADERSAENGILRQEGAHQQMTLCQTTLTADGRKERNDRAQFCVH